MSVSESEKEIKSCDSRGSGGAVAAEKMNPIVTVGEHGVALG